MQAFSDFLFDERPVMKPSPVSPEALYFYQSSEQTDEAARMKLKFCFLDKRDYQDSY
uniref:Transferase, transferring glycosyl groups n=1 Tax=Solanum tuberosum TaxID=4113 RepID=M1CQ09_SOLTU